MQTADSFVLDATRTTVILLSISRYFFVNPIAHGYDTDTGRENFCYVNSPKFSFMIMQSAVGYTNDQTDDMLCFRLVRFFVILQFKPSF